MNREVHVRFWERLGVKVPWATRQIPPCQKQPSGWNASEADARAPGQTLVRLQNSALVAAERLAAKTVV
mgnify:CR=1 FL=1